MGNLKKLVFGLLAMLVMVTSVNAELTEIPADDGNGKITLTDDVKLNATYVVSSEKNITIDLNGHTITAPTTGYAIQNLGTLTIQNSNAETGKIVGNSKSSAVDNNGKFLQISGVTIESPFICLKNEPDKVAIVNNSSFTTNSNDDHSAILNYGDLNVSNSNIIGTTRRSTAVLVDNGETATKKSTTTLNNCKISTVSGGVALATGEDSSIVMNGGSLEGTLGLTQKGTIKITGEVEAKLSTNISKYLQPGSKLVISGDDTITQDYIINEDITLTVKEDTNLKFIRKISSSLTYVASLTINGKVDGNIEKAVAGHENGARVYNETNKTYYGLLEQALKNTKSETTNDIVLLADTDESVTLWDKKDNSNKLYNNKDVNLDLNGHNVKANIVNNEEAKLVINDVVGGAELDGVITNNGELTLMSGNYTNVPVTGENATTILNGGSFPVDQISEELLPEGKELEKNTYGTMSVVDTEYVVSVEKAENGTVTLSSTKAIKGDVITITVKANEGFKVTKVLVNGGEVKANEDGTYSYVMTAADAKVTVEFEKTPVNTEGDGEPTTEVSVEKTEGTKEVTLSTEANDALKESLTKTEDKELQAFLEENEDVTVHLEANKVEKENVAKEVVAKFESVVKNATVAEYFDLDILVTAEGQDVHYLKELSKPITLTVDLPKLPEVAKGYTRTYYILREHNGVYEKLNATLTKDGKLSFATDKFSKYAIAYVDEKVKNPGTLDSIVSIVTLAISSIGTAGYSIKKFIRK